MAPAPFGLTSIDRYRMMKVVAVCQEEELGVRRKASARGAVRPDGLSAGMPPRLRALFWDVDAGALDLAGHRKYIIERVLEFGDEAAYRWLFSAYPDEEIISVVKASRRISRRTAAMMANFYRIPEAEVRCLQTACGREFWPY